MKIPRLTFTKRVIQLVSIITPLLIVYHWTPIHIEGGGKFVLMMCTIIAWQFGKFVYKVITTD